MADPIRQIILGSQKAYGLEAIVIDGITYQALQIDANGLLVPMGATPLRSAPAANNAAVINIAALASVRHQLCYITYDYTALAAAGTLTVEDGAGNTVYSEATVTTALAETRIPFTYPLRGSVNTAMIITLPTGGAGVSGVLNIGYIDSSSN